MGYRSIFFGLIFMFDFKVNGFDILPDIIGYFLIFAGLNILSKENTRFQYARRLAVPLIILSIFDLLSIRISTDKIYFELSTTLILILGLLSSVLYVLMIYFICKGLEETAKLKWERELAEMARNRWNLFLLFQLALAGTIVYAYFSPLASPFVIGVFIFSIVVNVLLITLMSEADRRLS